MNYEKRDRSSERGSAATKFLAVLVVLVVGANAGFNYVPIAYEGENFKQEMQTAVVNGLAMPVNVNPIESVKARIIRAAQDNDVPKDMVLDLKQNGAMISARVTYTKKVNLLPFGMYVYDYQFDHTAVPSGYLMKDSK